MILVRHGQSEFNVHYAKTRIDPGIVDPVLTEEGRLQAQAAAEILRAHEIERVLASPFTRTLQTAEIIAGALKLPVEIEPLVHEHAAFICDIGTPAGDLAKRWPDWRFDHLPDRWWPESEQEEQLQARCQRFWDLVETHTARPRTLVVTHWGFIRALTGLRVGNGHLVRFTAPGQAELLHPREMA